MHKYILLGCMVALMLTGCGESKEEEQERKLKEFWGAKYDDSPGRAKREKLFDECFDKNVRSFREIHEKAKSISGSNNIVSKEFQAALKPMEIERASALAKCNELRAGY